MNYEITETIQVVEDPQFKGCILFETSYKIQGLAYRHSTLSSSIDIADLKTLREHAIISF